MFNRKDDSGYVEALPSTTGILRKTLVHGEKTLMTEFRLEKEKLLPIHTHPYEQTGYLVSGRMVLLVEDSEFPAGPGDSWCIPGGIRHGARTIDDCVAVEVFSPVRKDYLG